MHDNQKSQSLLPQNSVNSDDDVVDTSCPAECFFAPNTIQSKVCTVFSMGLLFTCSSKLILDGINDDDLAMILGLTGAALSTAGMIGGFTKYCVDKAPGKLAVTRLLCGISAVGTGYYVSNYAVSPNNTWAWPIAGFANMLSSFSLFANGAQNAFRLCVPARADRNLRPPLG